MNNKQTGFSLDRSESLSRIRETKQWDLIVIGGGATGLGTALDAVSRGFNVLLLEQADFCKATSSRSTKLIHGGVRYLEQAEVGLVRSALKERGQLLNNAPHVVTEANFVIPGHNLWERIYYGLGLKVYDLLSFGHRLGSSKFLSQKQLKERVPNINSKHFNGGIGYRDAQFDDARLGIQLAQTITEQGGTVINSFEVTGFLRTKGKINGVRAIDKQQGETYLIRADSVINATGIFTDSIRSMVNPETEPLLSHSRGSHIVVDQKFLAGSSAILVPKTNDDRVLFAIPWENRTLIGTTDIPVDEPVMEPVPTPEEIDYMIEHIDYYLEESPDRSDILSVFAGLRPLVSEDTSNTSEISRDHHLEIDPSGLITIAGGKWTTFRRMGEDAVEMAIDHSFLPDQPSRSREIQIHGYQDRSESVKEKETSALSGWGQDRKRIKKWMNNQQEMQTKLHPNLPYPRGIVTWCTRHEMVRGVEDILARRTRALFLDAQAAIESAEDVAQLMAEEVNQDEKWKEDQVAKFKGVAQNYLPPE